VLFFAELVLKVAPEQPIGAQSGPGLFMLFHTLLPIFTEPNPENRHTENKPSPLLPILQPIKKTIGHPKGSIRVIFQAWNEAIFARKPQLSDISKKVIYNS